MKCIICPSHEEYSTSAWNSAYNMDANGNIGTRVDYSYQWNAINTWNWVTWSDGNANHYGPAGQKDSKLDAPADCAILWESCAPEAWSDNHYYGYNSEPWPCQPRIPHNGGMNVAYADGHAKWSRWSKLTPNNLSMKQAAYTMPGVPEISTR